MQPLDVLQRAPVHRNPDPPDSAGSSILQRQVSKPLDVLQRHGFLLSYLAFFAVITVHS